MSDIWRKRGFKNSRGKSDPATPDPAVEPPKHSATMMRDGAARNDTHRPLGPEIPGSNPGPAPNNKIFRAVDVAKDKRVCCPECTSQKVWKDGLRYIGGHAIQRFLCRKCGFRFSAGSRFEAGSNPAGFSYLEPNRHGLNRRSGLSNRQICVSQTKGAKNLADMQGKTRIERPQREGTLSQQKIIDYIWFMKKNGRAESTILSRVKLIKRLAKLGADLYDPEDVKRVIASQEWTAGRKALACDAYATFLALIGGSWQRPMYKPVEKEPFIPQPSEVKQLIAGCSSRMACFLQVMFETAMRPGEVWTMVWKDYDEPTRTLKATPEKGSRSRTYKISKELAAMIEALPRKYGDRMFSLPSMRLDHHSRNFCKQRQRIACKLKNTRLLNISFKTLRHFKATLEAWRTKDPFHVQGFLRHRNIKNTMRYIHLAKTLFKDEQEYVCKVAHNVHEACRLLEDGWKYQTGEYGDGGKIFTKPKDPYACGQ